MARHAAGLIAALALVTTTLDAQPAAGGPSAKTLDAWNAYVAATEARIDAELASPSAFLLTDSSPDRRERRDALHRGAILIDEHATADSSGTIIDVPDGTIAHWRGAVFLRGIMLESLLQRLQHPNERGPFPEDVVTLRVRDRRPDWIALAMRLTRRSIVRVTYDTEHVVSYRRWGSRRASSTSISTRIAEVADAGTAMERVLPPGEDRGFLWEMNSYWRFEQESDGVIVELESLTLSRSVPFGLGRIVAPVVDRIARDSMQRTLAGFRALYAADDPVRTAGVQ
jgi:hypothetical protein